MALLENEKWLTSNRLRVLCRNQTRLEQKNGTKETALLLHSPETARLYRKLADRGIKLHFIAYSGIAFHGTTILAAQSIQEQQFFNFTPSRKGTLGEGVYLFDDEPLAGSFVADDFARHKHKTHRVATVAAKLQFAKLLDLTARRNLPYFLAIQDWFFEQIGDDPKKWKKVTPGKIEHFLIKTCPYMAGVDGVRWEGFEIPSRQDLTQIGFCVKKKNCIRQIKMQIGASF
jgi:hypothetical protein